MVLSPGAGIASAAGVQLPPFPREKLYKPFDKPPEAWYNKGAKKRKEETPQ